MGFLNLAGWPVTSWLGGDQFRKICIISTLILIITIWVTCYTQEEKPRERDPMQRTSSNGLANAIVTITRALKTLPRPVQRVCVVQIFAFMGWFPFLFYGTTWIGQVMAAEIGEDPDVEKATRAGDFAMLIYSLIAITAGTLLPYLASRDHRLLARSDEDDEEDVELARIREMVRQWKLEAARKGKPLKLPRMPFMLRNIWTAAMLLFSAVMMSTFFIRTVAQATVAISLLGICWAVAVWVPFSIIMEFLKEMDQAATKATPAESIARRNALEAAASSSTSARPFQRVASTPSQLWKQGASAPTERSRLLRRHSYKEELLTNEMNPTGAPAAGGTVLGIHNLAVVLPQFLIALIASAIFKLTDPHTKINPDGPDNVYYGKNGVSWVLRFGGLCALIGALISRRVPPTRTEKLMRARLAEMRESQEAGSP